MSRRHGLRLAGVGCLALVAGLLSGSGSAAGEQSARVVAGYECAVPGGGSQAVEVDLAQGYPESGVAGKAIRPGELTVRVTVPAGGVAKLLPEGAATVGGTAALTALVTQGSERAEAGWSGLGAKEDEVRVPAGGELELGFAGKVAPVTVGAGGDVGFAAGRLELRLKTASAAGKAAAAELTCAPADGARTKLATVPVEEAGSGGTSDAPSESAEPRADGDGSIDTGAQPLASADKCPVDPPKGKLNKAFLPKPPSGATVDEGEPTSMCAVPVGFATMKKQGASAIVNDPRGRRKVGLMRLAFQMRTVSAENYDEYDSLGIMDLADTRSTFLTFGFQPTTATVRFEADPATVVNIVKDGKASTTAGYYQHLRLFNVTLNGAPLDVGPRCRTSKKILTVMKGQYPVTSGGILTGSIDIPKFSGCGSGGEDLDPLINASIAGPDNPLKIRQGPVTGGGSKVTVPELPEL